MFLLKLHWWCSVYGELVEHFCDVLSVQGRPILCGWPQQKHHHCHFRLLVCSFRDLPFMHCIHRCGGWLGSARQCCITWCSFSVTLSHITVHILHRNLHLIGCSMGKNCLVIESSIHWNEHATEWTGDGFILPPWSSNCAGWLQNARKHHRQRHICRYLLSVGLKKIVV